MEGGIMDWSLGYTKTTGRHTGGYRIGGLPQNPFMETESPCQPEPRAAVLLPTHAATSFFNDGHVAKGERLELVKSDSRVPVLAQPPATVSSQQSRFQPL